MAIFSEINAIHVGRMIIKEEDVKGEVKQTNVLNGGKTFHNARAAHLSSGSKGPVSSGIV